MLISSFWLTLWLAEVLTGNPVVDFASGMLHQAAERNLVLHADLIAGILSLLRFLTIRDKVFHIDFDKFHYEYSRVVLHKNRTTQLEFNPT